MTWYPTLLCGGVVCKVLQTRADINFGQDNFTAVCPQGTKGRYIYVQALGKGRGTLTRTLAFREIAAVVTGAPSVRAFRNVTTSSMWGSDHASLGADMDPNTFFASSGKDKNPWFQGDMGETKLVTAVALQAVQNCNQYRMVFEYGCIAPPGGWAGIQRRRPGHQGGSVRHAV
jgi:hypothetical protein